MLGHTPVAGGTVSDVVNAPADPALVDQYVVNGLGLNEATLNGELSTALATVAATLAVTESNDTALASSTVTVSANLAVADAAEVVSASGTVVLAGVSGTLAVTESNDTTASASTVAVSTGLSKTESFDTALAVSTITVGSSLSNTESNDTALAVSTVTVGANLAAADATEVVSSSATVTSTAITATLAVTESNDALVNDPYYSQVSLLLHADGTNGSTTITDSGPSAFSPTVFGAAQISTAQSKFGGASLALDGSGSYLQYADSAAWEFGAGAFTIEFWARKTSAAGLYTVVSKVSSGPFNGFQFVLGGTSVYFASFVGGTSTSFNPAFTHDTNWHHYAVSSTGATTYLFADGVLIGSGAAAAIGTSTAAVMRVGIDWDAVASPFAGNIDDLRITKGVARYTANFTPDGFPAPQPAAITGVGVSGVVASLAVTEASDLATSAATVVTNVTFSLAVVESNDVATSSAVVSLTASLAAVEGQDTVAGGMTSITTLVTASLAATERDDRVDNDPYFANVTLLLHADGVNGSTSYVDSSNVPMTVLASGASSMTTAQAKFGSSSIDQGTVFTDYLTAYNGASDPYGFGTGPLTIECWVRPRSSSGTYNVIQSGKVGATFASDSAWTVSQLGTQWMFTLNVGATMYTITGGTVVANTWTHLAVTRQGSTMYAFADGVSIGTLAISGAVNSSTSTFIVCIGGSGSISGTSPSAGYIDEVRITKGVARYLAAFTAPTAPSPTPAVVAFPSGVVFGSNNDELNDLDDRLTAVAVTGTGAAGLSFDKADTVAASAGVTVGSALTSTDSADTLSAAEAVALSATLSVTDGGDIPSGTIFIGNIVAATLAVTERADSVSAALALSVDSSANVSEKSDALTSAAATTVVALASAQDGADTLTANAAAVVGASLGVKDAADVLGAAAGPIAAMTLAVRESDDTLSGGASIAATTRVATLLTYDNADGFSAAASIAISASAAPIDVPSQVQAQVTVFINAQLAAVEAWERVLGTLFNFIATPNHIVHVLKPADIARAVQQAQTLRALSPAEKLRISTLPSKVTVRS